MNTSPTLLDTSLDFSVSAEATAAPMAGTKGISISKVVGLNGSGPANVTDSDAGAVTGIALIGTNEFYGYWWYSTDNGAHWALVGPVNDSNSALLLRSTDLLYFQPGVAVPSTVNHALTIRAWDQTTGIAGTKAGISVASGGAFSAASDSVTLHPAVLVPNGSFDNGLNGWTSTGGSSVGATGDGHQGIITSASGLPPAQIETFLGLSNGSIAAAAGTVPSLGHAMKMSNPVTVTEDTTLSIEWSFAFSDSGTYQDFGFISVDGVVTLLAKAANASGTFSTVIPANTTVSLGFGAFDTVDNSVSPILVVDNIRVTTVNPMPATPLFPAPSTPNTPSAPDLHPASDTGHSASDNITTITTPTFNGTADDGTTVVLYDGTTVVGSGIATNGAWSITASALTDGTHTLTARTTNVASHLSNASDELTVIVDTTPPAAPPAPTLSAASDTDTVGDGITTVKTPVIEGTAEAFSAVTLYDSDGTTVLGMTTANGAGAWSITSSALADGQHMLTVKAVDAAGNGSVVSGGLAIEIVSLMPTPTEITGIPILSPFGMVFLSCVVCMLAKRGSIIKSVKFLR